MKSKTYPYIKKAFVNDCNVAFYIEVSMSVVILWYLCIDNFLCKTLDSNQLNLKFNRILLIKIRNLKIIGIVIDHIATQMNVKLNLDTIVLYTELLCHTEPVEVYNDPRSCRSSTGSD
ncbi:hypothetical protein D1818_01100 [Aquimarina sp. BL5]|nr:hypothetical protein D1818_01100 [Aquimarina sp. BL5]RKN04379.1 hypothetical protein D7036_12345 [Aquimarina sp. BL5]